MVFVWVAAAIAGLFVAVTGSRHAVDHATALARRTQLPGFVVGITLLAIGTDLPEIANSVIASARGNGDVNVGDSVGSAATQLTLVLGLLPFVGKPLLKARSGIVAAGLLTAGALALGALFVADGFLARPEASVLVVSWLVATFVVWRVEPETMRQLELEVDEPDTTPVRTRVSRTAVALLFVAGGAFVAVWGIVEIAAEAGIPAYIISFFGASIGTSLPELVVVLTAIRRGQTDLAIGDGFGASMVDSTLSIGIGPLLFPTAVTASLAVVGALSAAAIAVLVTLLFSRIPTHDRRSGLLLLILYAGLYAVVLG